MGNGIAHIFAQCGFKVSLIDINETALEKAIETISKNLDRQIQKGSLTENEKQNTLGNITTFLKMKDGVEHAEFVIEAATENINGKLSIFKELDELCKPETILASNTSSISISKLASVTGRPEKVIGMHFMNPVPIMKLVEIINGYETNNQVTSKTIELCNQLGKIPIAIQDYPGFVANRILMPMINEAIYTLYENVGGVVEIDTIMKLGMAHPMGPLQLADFIGLDVCLAIMRVLHDGFGNPKYAPCPLLVKMVTAGQLGKKTGIGFYDYSSDSKELVVAPNFKKSGN